MKKLLVILVLLFVASSFVAAQGNGNGGGNGNSTGTWGSWPGYICDWLNCGGAIPQPLALEIVRESRGWGQANFGLSLGQMIQKYRNGELVILYLPTSPPAAVLTFRVSFGGGLINIEIDDNL